MTTNNETSTPKKVQSTKKVWYKTGWGVVGVILILPFFAIWYVWAKTKWNKKTKWITTGAISLFIIFGMTITGSTPPSTTTTNNQQNETEVKKEFKQEEKKAEEPKIEQEAPKTDTSSTSQIVIPTPSVQQQPTTASTNSPQVKKSSTDICHEKGSTYYDKTKTFRAYNSIQECLDSGGRLPKR